MKVIYCYLTQRPWRAFAAWCTLEVRVCTRRPDLRAQGDADMWPQLLRGITKQLASSPWDAATTSLFSSTHEFQWATPRAVVLATGRLADALGDHFLTEFFSVLPFGICTMLLLPGRYVCLRVPWQPSLRSHFFSKVSQEFNARKLFIKPHGNVRPQ